MFSLSSMNVSVMIGRNGGCEINGSKNPAKRSIGKYGEEASEHARSSSTKRSSECDRQLAPGKFRELRKDVSR